MWAVKFAFGLLPDFRLISFPSALAAQLLEPVQEHVDLRRFLLLLARSC